MPIAAGSLVINIVRKLRNGLMLGILCIPASGCMSTSGGPIGFSMISPTLDDNNLLKKISISSQIEIQKPGEILEGISSRHQIIKNNGLRRICLNPQKYIDYRSNVEIRKYFKDPNDLRKTAFAENLVHKLIISSSEFLGTNDSDAGKYAIRILVSYARQDRPMLDQGSRYGHTLGSAAQFIFAAAIAHTILLSSNDYLPEDQRLVSEWLKRKALDRHIKFKDHSKWYGYDGVKRPVKTDTVSGFQVNCCAPMAYESTRLQVDNALMAVSILHNDIDGFASALKGYVDVLNTIRTDGSLPYQTARGNAAIWYQNLGINVLVMAAEMAANQGIDLYRYKAPSGADLHQAIAFLALSLEKPTVIIPYAQKNINPWRKGNGITDPNDHTKQLGQFKIPKLQRNGASFLAWFEPYQNRFPNHPNIKTLSVVSEKIVQKGGQAWKKVKLPYTMDQAKKSGGLFNDYTGTNLSCLFKDTR